MGGTDVIYKLTDDGFLIVSAGPDKKHGTADDVSITDEQIKSSDK